MEVFMKRRGYGVLNSSLNSVGCESCAKPLSEPRCPSPIISWMVRQLSDPCPSNHASDCFFPKGRMSPVLSVRMGLVRLNPSGLRVCTICKKNGEKRELGDPAHTSIAATSMPSGCYR